MAALLPSEWEKRLVDIKVEDLADEDLRWADYVFLSAMIVQRNSAQAIIQQGRGVASLD